MCESKVFAQIMLSALAYQGIILLPMNAKAQNGHEEILFPLGSSSIH